MGFRNVVVRIPFCRTPEEADRVLEVMAEHGLSRGEDDLRIWVMAEIPSNVIEAESFAERFDGFSIGSNDLTQLVLGVSRDEERLRKLFDERSPSVTWMIRELVRKAHADGRTVSLCGQAPSDHPEFATFLVEAGLDSISVNPDSVVVVLERVAHAERACQHVRITAHFELSATFSAPLPVARPRSCSGRQGFASLCRSTCPCEPSARAPDTDTVLRTRSLLHTLRIEVVLRLDGP